MEYSLWTREIEEEIIPLCRALQIHPACRGRANSQFSLSPRTKWITIECPCQPNEIDCGYYVMKFIKDVVVHNQMQIPTTYFLECKCQTYSDDQLIEIKQEWCRYLVDFINLRYVLVVIMSLSLVNTTLVLCIL